jgi:hypothetical protein
MLVLVQVLPWMPTGGSVQIDQALAADAEPTIEGICLTEKDQRLYLYFSLKNGFSQQIVDIIQSGIPVSYTFEIGITKEGRFWNKDLVNIRLLKVLSFDNIRNQYLITINYPDTRVINFRSLESARQYVSNVKDLPLIRLSMLEKGTSYTLKLKAEVKKKESKMPFYGLMKMFSSFKLETDWYEVQFSY